jgi:hypothetical protein
LTQGDGKIDKISDEINRTITLTNLNQDDLNHFIQAYILQIDDFDDSYKRQLENQKYAAAAEVSGGGADNNYIFKFKRGSKEYNYAMILMPSGDGDLRDLKDSNWNINHREITFHEKNNIFKKVLESLMYILAKCDLVYPDIKLEQIIYRYCTHDKIKISIGDLGGLQPFKDKAIYTYGPYNPEDALHFNSESVALFALAVFWGDNYGYHTCSISSRIL